LSAIVAQAPYDVWEDELAPASYRRAVAPVIAAQGGRRISTRRRPMRVTLTVNGEQRSPEIDPRRLLVEVLREELGLSSTHIGCLNGDWGVWPRDSRVTRQA
jgi:hypothetical protein